LICNHSRQIKLQILRLQLRRKAITNAILLTRRNLNIVSRSGKITNYGRALAAGVRRPKITAYKDDVDGLRFFVADGEEGLGWMTVYKLDAKDLGRGERG